MNNVQKGIILFLGQRHLHLYDTYGFPIELTEEYAEEANMTVDHEGSKKKWKHNVIVHVQLVKM